MATTDESDDDPETVTINIRVTETQLAEIDAVWKEEGYTSRSEFLRHAIRDATSHPGATRSMLASIAAEEYAMRTENEDSISRDEVLALMDDDE